MSKPLIIGLTGPSGAGKSIVSLKLSEDPAIRCIDMDQLSREVTRPRSPTLQALSDAFSTDILHADGSLDRRKLAELAFATAEGTKRLNAITHPAIWRETEHRLAELALHSDVKAVLLDAPLLLESGMDQICDRVLVVLAPPEVRLDRICRRDGISLQQAELRLKRQQSDAFYIDKADLVVQNTVDEAELPAMLRLVQMQVERWCDDV